MRTTAGSGRDKRLMDGSGGEGAGLGEELACGQMLLCLPEGSMFALCSLPPLIHLPLLNSPNRSASSHHPSHRRRLCYFFFLQFSAAAVRLSCACTARDGFPIVSWQSDTLFYDAVVSHFLLLCIPLCLTACWWNINN